MRHQDIKRHGELEGIISDRTRSLAALKGIGRGRIVISVERENSGRDFVLICGGEDPIRYSIEARLVELLMKTKRDIYALRSLPDEAEKDL